MKIDVNIKAGGRNDIRLQPGRLFGGYFVLAFLSLVGSSVFLAGLLADSGRAWFTDGSLAAVGTGEENADNIDPVLAADPEFNNWWGEAQERVRAMEYQPTLQEQDSVGNELDDPAFHYANRNQNLRSYIGSTGWSLERRNGEDEEPWSWKYELRTLGRDGELLDLPDPESGAVTAQEDGTVNIDRGVLTEWYRNSTDGVEQGFTVRERPEGNGMLKLAAEITTDLAVNFTGPDRIVFGTSDKDTFVLDHLYAMDADGKELPASFIYENSTLTIAVNDAGASYPVIIDPLASSPDWTADSDQASALFGYSVASAGDVNNDGYDDVIVGAHKYDNGQSDEGRAYVYHGSASGLSASPDWTVEINQATAWFGNSVASAGDVNNDGYDDVIVGAPYYDNGEGNEGGAFVYHGSASGLSTSADWTAESNKAVAFFGNSVASAGDVNNDGYGDVIIGARVYDNQANNEGRAYVYLGSSSGLAGSAVWTMDPTDQASAEFGFSVASAGDVNNDGYDDVIVGAYKYDNGQADEGRAYVYYGRSSGVNTSPAWVKEIDEAYSEFGGSVASAGDVNNDGYSDVIVGAPNYSSGGSGEGGAFVYLGSAVGLSASADWTGDIDQNYSEFGYSVASAGDVNNDGYSDVIVGAYKYDNGQADEGGVFVYLGSASGPSSSADWTVESDQGGAMFGYSVASAGDVNNDGYSDVLVGAQTYLHGQSLDGRVFLYLGLGAVEYTLAYAAGDNGSITGTTPQTVEEGGDGTEVTAVADEGYSFVSWSDGVLTASRTDVNVTDDINVTAAFALDVPVVDSVDAQAGEGGAAPIANSDTVISVDASYPGGVARVDVYLDGTDQSDLIGGCDYSPATTPVTCSVNAGILSQGYHSRYVKVTGADASETVSQDDLRIAGETLNGRALLSTLGKGSENVDFTLAFTLAATQPSGTLTVTFDEGFTVTAPATSAGSSSCLSNFGHTSSTLTATKTDCVGGVILAGARVTNPSTAGSYGISWSNDNGWAAVIIVESQDIDINATVDPVISFLAVAQPAASTCAPGSDLAGDDYTLDLGSLNVSSLTESESANADSETVERICTQGSTNASSGMSVTVKNLNGSNGLVSTSVPADYLPSDTTGVIAPGDPAYGICVVSGSLGSDAGLTPASTDPAAIGDFATYDCAAAGNAVALDGTSQGLWSTSSVTQDATASVWVRIAISGTTPAHNDYTDALTFVATASY